VAVVVGGAADRFVGALGPDAVAREEREGVAPALSCRRAHDERVEGVNFTRVIFFFGRDAHGAEGAGEPSGVVEEPVGGAGVEMIVRPYFKGGFKYEVQHK